MNKYIVLSAVAFVITLSFGCQNCGYKTAHSSRYETLVGTTRLASPQTNCRYNTCSVANACNPCNPCNPCSTQMLANNGSYNPSLAVQNGWYDQYAGESASANSSLLDASQSQAAQGETPLRWRSVTEEEQQYANSSFNTESVGVASALGNPAFGSPAPAPSGAPPYPDSYNYDAAVGVAQATRRRPGPPQYPPRYPNSSPRAAAGVASALNGPGYPYQGGAPQYPPQYPSQYPNSSPRAAAGVSSALTPGYPSRGGASPYPSQYPTSYPGASGDPSALSVPEHPLPPQYSNSNPYSGYSPRSGAGTPSSFDNSNYDSSNADSVRWRHVTEEEQQYSRSAAQTPGYGNEQPLTVPVYQGGNAETPQTTDIKAPEIDPNALPSLNPQSGTF